MSARDLRLAVRAALLDLDGTLLDTIPDLAAAANMTLVEIGRAELPIETIRNYVGKGIPVLVKRCLTGHLGDDAPLAQEELDRVVPIFKRYYAEVNGAATTIYPGVIEGLGAMRAAGLPLAVVTNKAHDFTVPLLARMGLAAYFDVVVSGDTVEHKKPHPGQLLYACEKLGTLPAETVMIGDSANDILAGRAAGCRTLCLPYGYNEGGDVRDLECDAIVATLVEAAAMLDMPPGA